MSTCQCKGECGSDHESGTCEVPHDGNVFRHSADPSRWSLDKADSIFGKDIPFSVRIQLIGDAENTNRCIRCHLYVYNASVVTQQTAQLGLL